MQGREAAQAEQRQGHGDLAPLHQRFDLPHGARHDDAVPGQDNGPAGLIDHLDGAGHLRGVALQGRTITRQLRGILVPVELHRGLLGVLGDIHQHRPRPSRLGDKESFADAAPDVADARHQRVVLGDGQGHARDVDLLEGVAADQLGAHLAGDAHHRRGIHHGGGDAGDHVGRPGTGGGYSHAHLAAGARVTVRHVRGALLMPCQSVVDLGKLPYGVVSGEDGSAGVAEHVGHALANQTLPNNFRACHFLRTHNDSCSETMQSSIFSQHSPLRPSTNNQRRNCTGTAA